MFWVVGGRYSSTQFRIFDKTQSSKMDSFAAMIRRLREEKKATLQTVAADTDIDQAILSKLESGKHHASREQVVKLAAYYGVEESDLLVAWLSDKVVYEVAGEQVALEALQVAEEKISYKTKPETENSNIINLIRTILENDGRVAAAWLFGSIARNEEKPHSDVDIMVEMNSKRKYSMFDLLDIAYIIEQKIDRKVDLVEKGYLRDFAMKTASGDLIKIYG